MLKLKSKKKQTKNSGVSKSQNIPKKETPKPEWDATQSDLDKYKLSQAELVQRKVSMMSKHQFEAKELWLKRQEKLKKGIDDEETQLVKETVLNSKRPPEKNKKNLTYFIKDEHYNTRDHIEDKENEDHYENEDYLSLQDLHHIDDMKEIIKTEKENKERGKSQNKGNNEEDGGDVIKRVNQSLKEAKEFIGKIERYPSIKKSADPEKTLTALQSLQKENKSKISTKPSQPRSTTTNVKGNIKTTKAPQHAAGNSHVDKKINAVDSTLKNESGQRDSLRDAEKHYDTNNEDQEDHEEISHYFQSLNQIEDTIKFLEENIIGVKPTEKVVNTQENLNQKSQNKDISNVKNNDNASKKLTEETAHANQTENKLDIMDLKNEALERENMESHEKLSEHELTPEDEQISFDLTMRSSEHTDSKSKHDHYNHVDDFKDLLAHDGIEEPLKKSSNPSSYQQSQISFPQVIFENKALQDKPKTVSFKEPNVQSNTNIQNKTRNEPLEENDEDINIERIKNMLQATRLEIDKMNTNPSETYKGMPKKSYEVDKENVSNNIALKNSFGVKGSNVQERSEPQIYMKQTVKPSWDNQIKILRDVKNDEEFPEEEVPAPQTLGIKKHYANYSPQNIDDNSLSIRSFRKKI